MTEIFDPLLLLGIFIAGGLGSALRFAISKFNGFWPWGILLANILGSFIAGWAVIYFKTDLTWLAILVVGLAGGLSTFSAWAAGTVQLVSRDRPVAAALYTIMTLILSSTAAYVGLLLG
jgi:CrcB protein